VNEDRRFVESGLALSLASSGHTRGRRFTNRSWQESPHAHTSECERVARF
jgi:hypothetical protein